MCIYAASSKESYRKSKHVNEEVEVTFLQIVDPGQKVSMTETNISNDEVIDPSLRK